MSNFCLLMCICAFSWFFPFQYKFQSTFVITLTVSYLSISFLQKRKVEWECVIGIYHCSLLLNCNRTVLIPFFQLLLLHEIMVAKFPCRILQMHSVACFLFLVFQPIFQPIMWPKYMALSSIISKELLNILLKKSEKKTPRKGFVFN